MKFENKNDSLLSPSTTEQANHIKKALVKLDKAVSKSTQWRFGVFNAADNHDKIPKEIIDSHSKGDFTRMLRLTLRFNKLVESYNSSDVAASASGLIQYKVAKTGPGDGTADEYVYTIIQSYILNHIDLSRFDAIIGDIIKNIKVNDTPELLANVKKYANHNTIDISDPIINIY